MEDWKVRMIEEYKQLRERADKLTAALDKEDSYVRFGKMQYTLMTAQLIGMNLYKRSLEQRLDDLNIEVK